MNSPRTKMSREFPRTVKLVYHQAKTTVRYLAAWTLRRIPVSWSVLGVPRGEVSSLKSWVKDRGDRASDRWQQTKGPHCELRLGPMTVRRPAPKTIGGRRVPKEFTSDQHTVHAELFLAVLPGARVLGPNGTVITPEGHVVAESTWPRRSLPAERAWTALSLPRCKKLAGRYYSIASPNWSGYYHWVTEVLPRLFALDTLIGDDIRILVNAPLNDWQRESLTILGYDPDRCVPVCDGYVEAELLYLPSFVGDPSPHPFACRWLRERLIPADAPAQGDRRLYVTRRAARCRRVENEVEIEPILKDHGFEIVEAERLTFREQVALFSQAAIVAGPHGAGLTNILFAPDQCKVLEFFQPTYYLASTYKLATCRNQEYCFLTGETVVSATTDSANTTDIRINAGQLEASLIALSAIRRDPDMTHLPRKMMSCMLCDPGDPGHNSHEIVRHATRHGSN